MIAIVGGGISAISAAAGLRESGYEGTIRLLSGESAPPYDRTTLSKNFLTEQLRDVPVPALESSILDSVDLSLRTKVLSISSRTRTLATSEGETVEFQKLLIATGARCRVLQIPGSELPGVHYLRELDDAIALRAALQSGMRLVIVGGGVIGLELAASAVHLGCRTTVVEASGQLLGRVLPRELSTTIASHHRERGVMIKTGIPPAALVEAGGHICGVQLADETFIPADVVVVGIGVTPRTELAADAGLSVDNGIVVDQHFRTSVAEITACGDAASVFHAAERRYMRTESWQSAQDQGRLAATNMLGTATPYADVPWMWSDQHDLTIQVTGFGFAGTQVVRRGDLSDRDGVCYLGVRDDRLVAAAGASFGPRIARTISPAQQLIEARVVVGLRTLNDPEFRLRDLLRVTA